MVRGKEEAEWNRLSNLLCLIRNVNLWGDNAKPSKPSDFNPFAKDIEKQLQDDGFAAAKEVARQAGAFSERISE
jgi:hypothetical protein